MEKINPFSMTGRDRARLLAEFDSGAQSVWYAAYSFWPCEIFARTYPSYLLPESVRILGRDDVDLQAFRACVLGIPEDFQYYRTLFLTYIGK